MPRKSEGIQPFNTRGDTHYAHRGFQHSIPRSDFPSQEELETREPSKHLDETRVKAGYPANPEEARVIEQLDGYRNKINERFEELLGIIDNLEPSDRQKVLEKLTALAESLNNVTDNDELAIEQRLDLIEGWIDRFLQDQEKIGS